MKTRENNSSNSFCEIYLQLLKNPPLKTRRVCTEKLNIPYLMLTGDVLVENRCQDIVKLDKQILEQARSACTASLDQNGLFRVQNKTDSVKESQAQDKVFRN